MMPGLSGRSKFRHYKENGIAEFSLPFLYLVLLNSRGHVLVRRDW
jgi:hypothetical protein